MVKSLYSSGNDSSSYTFIELCGIIVNFKFGGITKKYQKNIKYRHSWIRIVL